MQLQRVPARPAIEDRELLAACPSGLIPLNRRSFHGAQLDPAVRASTQLNRGLLTAAVCARVGSPFYGECGSRRRRRGWDRGPVSDPREAAAAVTAKNTDNPKLMDAGRAYPPTGDGRRPKVNSVDMTQVNGVTTAHHVGATPRRRSAAALRQLLKTAKDPSAPAALTVSNVVTEGGDGCRASRGSTGVVDALLYARMTRPQHR